MNNTSDKHVAIIGMGCRFPGGSNSIDQFWELLRAGKDAVTEVPADRWSLEEHYHPNKQVKGKSHSKAGGFIDCFDEFDAKFFGINAREADQMDPQQRQMLEIVWEALEDAGIKPASLNGSKTGVFIGGFTLDYKILQFADSNQIGTHAAVGSMMTMLSNRISYIYNFTGPSMSIDTACSSSLVSVHEACQSLRSGECGLALAGGIELIYAPEYFVAESKGGFLSVDGKCKTFDADANGYVRGEGGGILVLKPLEQALEDGDYIYAVIRDSLVNQDGKTNGITVPNGDSQRLLLEEVYARAGIAAEDVQYVELHGTGTALGDPIEVEAVGGFFGEGRTEDNRCIIASVKPNIGHLEAASGVASIIKAACTLDRREIVPHIGMKTLNPAIDLARMNLRIPLASEPWPEEHKPALIGVNSFGFGGTNAHVILQGAKNDKMYDGKVNGELPQILTLSAKSEQSLGALARRYEDYLASTGERLSDICYSALFRREKLAKSLAVSGRSIEELRQGLAAYNQGIASDHVVSGQESKDKRLAFIFTGMGPQWYAMGRELYHDNSVFRSTVERCHAEFAKYLDWSLLKEFLIDEDNSRMQYTEVSQPMNFTVQVALFEMWRSMGITPDLIIGHSVGEVAALYAADVYSFEEAVRISYYRSMLQQRLTGKGGMLAVSLTRREAEELIAGDEDRVSIAAINSNTSVTLSGDMACLNAIHEQLDREGIFNKFLRVTVPYHSVFMNEIKDELLAALADIQPKASTITLYTTANGQLAEGPELDNEYWWQNVSGSVYFAKAMEQILAAGYVNFVEVGPHPVLANSVKELAFELDKEILISPSLRRSEPEAARMCRTFSELLCAGVDIGWQQVYRGSFKYVKLPHYSWEHERFWKESAEHRQRRLGQKEHRFLGYRKNSFAPLWEAEINDYILPFVKDHCVNGKALLAGAHYIEASFQMIRHFSKLAINDIYAVNHIQFKKALFLDENQTARVLISYDPEHGTVKIGNAEGDGGGAENFRARFVRGQSRRISGRADLEAIKAGAREHLPKEECYSLLTRMNFNYGPMFQGLKEVWLGDGEVLAELCLPEELGVRDEDCILHPVLLDAAFQSFLVNQFDELRQHGKVDIKLPDTIDAVRVFGRAEGRLYVHSSVKQLSGELIAGDIRILDESGYTVAEVDNFVARAMERSEEQAVPGESALNEWFYGIGWKAQEPAEDEPLLTARSDYRDWIILCDEAGTGREIAARLTAEGHNCTLFYGDYQLAEGRDADRVIQSNNEADYQKIISRMDKNVEYGVLHLWSLDIRSTDDMGGEDIEAAKPKAVNSIRYLLNALNEQGCKYRAWMVTRGAVSVLADEPADVLQGAAIGMCRVISHSECVGSWGASIDMDDYPETLDLLVQDLSNYSREDQIAYRSGIRYVARLEHIYGLDGGVPVQLHGNKIYLVTGAMGSLGQITVRWMAGKGARHFVLIGRTPYPDKAGRGRIEPGHRLYDSVQFVRELEREGCTVRMAALDVADEAAVRQLAADLQAEEAMPVGGIVHIAGVVRDRLMMQMEESEFHEVFDTKAKGAWTLSKVFEEANLDFFLMYSSTGSVVTAVGQVNYAAGNSFLDTLAYYRRSKGMPAISLGWGPWGVGMVKEHNLIDHYKYQRGMNPIYAIGGMQALERVFGQKQCHVVIGEADWPLALQNYPGKPALYNHLALESKDTASEAQGADLFAMLAGAAGEEEQISIVEDFFAGIIAETVHAQKESLDLNDPVSAIGVDSIIATEIRNLINKNAGINLSIVDILGGTSIAGLARKYWGDIAALIVEDSAEELEELLLRLENMSEEEAALLLAE
ncbi:type I polyketide synthase ['Paenibacillus yunnanensis' Narsing Rao et al. 2020]|uniref:type I polyketide synthase n=1 Tax=Paenibacillus tengchongensis TaxID=2608684 RepID=UPI00124D14A0|nr:type I polyketide synthase [Paenibacillus tengchongensis]